MKRIIKYKLPNGKIPFDEWFKTLDKPVKVEVLVRLERVKVGLYGNLRNLSKGISELKFSNGNRIYFAEKNELLVILLTGGNKQRQNNDIKQAEKYFNDFLERDKNEQNA